MALLVRNRATLLGAVAEFDVEVDVVVRRGGRSSARCRSSRPAETWPACLRCNRARRIMPVGDQVHLRCQWTSEDPVSDVMSAVLATVRPDSTVEGTRSMLAAERLTGTLVAEKDLLVGVVSQSSLAGIPGHVPVSAVLPASCWVIDTEASLGRAAALMTQKNLVVVPVVKGREVRGVLSRNDLAEYGIPVD